MTKIDIFSGFLGAGKTTLIKKLIAEAYAGEKLVLIENEFGEIGIDGGFLADAGINVTEMNSGCICCSLVGDFGRALAEVLETYRPDRIIIEPSGVGKLSDVIRAVARVDSDEIKLGAFTTVVDVNKCKMYLKNFGEFFGNQIESASAIVLSHTGKATEEKISAAVALIREHNPDAVIITDEWDTVDGKKLLEAIEHTHTLEEEMHSLEEEHGICPECGHHHGHEHHHHGHDEECECHHHHGHDEECECHHHHGHDEECECHHHHDHDEECECGCHHEHDHEHHHHHHDHHDHHADEVFTSFGRETDNTYTAEEISAILTALEDEEKYGIILRAKGIVDGGDRYIHFDYVPGEPDVRYGSAIAKGRVCVIGSKIDEGALTELFRL